MKPSAIVVGLLLLMSGVTGAQQGNDGGNEIRRGAGQASQNKWNAKSPWGQTERSGPLSLQKKAPFKIFDNVYYVGFQTVSSYLVTTSEGLVLIDAGYAQTADWLLESIAALGFRPTDIKYILVTHSHLDHAGGAAKIQAVSKARVALSAPDWAEVERQQTSPQQQANFPDPLTRDVILKDGESIAVGDATFKFHFTPGHTPGSTSVEFQVRDVGRSYRALTPGGLGLHYQADWGPTFKSSIQRLKDRGPWDVMLSNHPFLMPRDLEQIEAGLKTRGTGPHPAILGPAAINGFWDATLKIVNEKLIAEPPTRPVPAVSSR